MKKSIKKVYFVNYLKKISCIIIYYGVIYM